ncbi:hypothetical protein Calag_1114 [Caldisphaera lagunensis DSM 15908]|uniref:Uncharacterized protein n=1 Tax=Caldisphaera lagunensis (strain DSM 15908 / JCM 11604 / ANMR 0165 / IC-154) TaxID=1056495 RepID=L0AAD9_CALLD|nr:hypothetical protein [Caldisphaera lagunensis]AFZ70836.1 hypothetical protein Calag_1114 [Caldisphaera lagunensis DSM 15908]
MSEENDSKKVSKDVRPEKADLSKALSIIPPASSLKEKGKKIVERRLRISYDEGVDKGNVKLSKKLASELGIQKKLEMVIASKKKLVFDSQIDESIQEETKVFVNPDEMKEKGVADNSIVTIRAFQE